MSPDLAELLDVVARARVCIVGDVLLDVFTRGYVDRVCPDTPALVVHEHQVTNRASGAAFAAQALRGLGADVDLVTALGHDAEARRVTQLVLDTGARLHAVRAERPTPTKERIVGLHPNAATGDGEAGAGGRVLLRVDREDTSDVPASVEAQLIAASLSAVHSADAVVVSDYAKGVCTFGLVRAVIEAARARGIPVVVDPKRPDPRHYSGATALTPNPRELAALIPPGRPAEPEQLRRDAAAEWVVLTRDAAGVTAVGSRGARLDVPAFADQVVDVAGAGDVLAGTLAAALAGTCGGGGGAPTPTDMHRALVLASVAAGISLRHADHKHVTAAELVEAAARHDIAASLWVRK